METIILYCFILALCCLTTYISNVKTVIYSANNKVLQILNYYKKLFIPIVIYTIFWGIRKDVGTDYENYFSLFSTFEEYKHAGHIEPGFNFLLSVLNNCGFSEISLFIFTCLFNVVSVYSLGKQYNRKYATYLIYFYFTSTLVLFAMNGIRQTMALSIFFIFLSYVNFYKKKALILTTLIAGLLAFMFHKSSIVLFLVFLVLCLAPRINIKVRYVYLVYVILFLIGYTFQSILLEYMSVYDILYREDQFSMAESLTGNGAKSLLSLGTLTVFVVESVIIFSKDLILFNKSKDCNYYIYWMAVFGLLLQNIFNGNFLLSRVSLYFYSLRIFVLSLFCYYLLKNHRSIKRRAFFWVIIVLNLLIFIVALDNNSNNCVPYLTVFDL